MKLLEDTGYLARVEIDGIEWYMTTKEYETMMRKPFHFWGHDLKRLNPQPHSCARCKNKPIDFCQSNKRTTMQPPWTYKPGTNALQLHKAIIEDSKNGTTEKVDQLKIFRKCPCFSWTRAALYYDTICEAGEWP